ncbi:hypothetical protein Pcaca04_36300 [Pectobacterium carotovorum subsp. carotovorum]|nr:hypothetical protein Pcaca04_36300 [Pectobacterium carotovorum subsp. carotovorum]
MTAKKGKGNVKSRARNNAVSFNEYFFISLILNDKKTEQTFLVMMDKPEYANN